MAQEEQEQFAYEDSYEEIAKLMANAARRVIGDLRGVLNPTAITDHALAKTIHDVKGCKGRILNASVTEDFQTRIIALLDAGGDLINKNAIETGGHLKQR